MGPDWENHVNSWASFQNLLGVKTRSCGRVLPGGTPAQVILCKPVPRGGQAVLAARR